MHYARWKRHGDVHHPSVPRTPGTLEQRLWRRLTSKPAEGCWSAKGGKQRDNYVMIWSDDHAHLLYAHRVAYELTYGPIPEGKIVCHSCDNPPCIRPDHLFLGEDIDNMRDKVHKGRHHNSKKTQCKSGHEFTPENTLWRQGVNVMTRTCKTCHYARCRRYREKKRPIRAA
jgi:hypothetical protein